MFAERRPILAPPPDIEILFFNKNRFSSLLYSVYKSL